MNIHVTGGILSNDTQITRISNFHPRFKKTVISGFFLSNSWRKKAVFFSSFSTTRVKRIIWNQHISVKVHVVSCCINIDKNNYPEEAELDTSPSLTLARTLTLSTGERSFGNFTPSLVTTPRFLILLIWIHQKIWGGIQSLDQKSISYEKSQLH